MVYGAILAGGMGKRIERYTIPKQFIAIGGVPIIVLAMRQFLRNSRIELVYVAVHKDWMGYAHNLLRASFSLAEMMKIRIVPGGKERIDSFINIMDDIVRSNGLKEEDILICHDAVRPFVRQQMINDCIDAALDYKLALTVIPVADTIHTAQDPFFIDGTMDRNILYHGQTPSGFNIALLYDACSRFDSEEKSKITGTTQLMLKLGYRIRSVKGHTSNFKITTDNDLDIADRMVRATRKRVKIELLDCTLRDGGIVIDFDYGYSKIQEIKECLENAGLQYIECGYIDEKRGSDQDRTCFTNEQIIKDVMLVTGKKKDVTYVAMIDYGAFDVAKLLPADQEGIDGIRLAFHKENWQEAIEWGKIIIKKGYQLYIQPMVTTRYSDEEFRELITHCNNELSEAKAFYIVDSFGQMDHIMLLHQLELADRYVLPSMKIGFHAHNNRQLAFSNACTLIKYPARHELMMDSSIMGMGKGAGNLCTELILPVLAAEGGSYHTIGIYELISNYFSQLMKTTPWGYCLDYYLSSLYGCTPSYIKIFHKDERVTTDILIDLLKDMPDCKKVACDEEFAQEYLNHYFEEQIAYESIFCF